MSTSGKVALRRFKKSRAEPRPAMLTTVILVTFYVVLYFALPHELRDRMPSFFQRIVAIVAGVLAMLATIFALREWGFYRSVKLAGIGRVQWATVLGALVFIVVLAWWLSPWAPLRAQARFADVEAVSAA
jgi:membrane associated rhomboid family serine protease